MQVEDGVHTQLVQYSAVSPHAGGPLRNPAPAAQPLKHGLPVLLHVVENVAVLDRSTTPSQF
ncbi:MAG: hypothetical protein ABI175_22410, partial [Polyangiales bacterium]